VRAVPSAKDCSLQQNGASHTLLGRTDGSRVHVAPRSKPLVRGADAERSGGFVAHAQSCGGACHAIERTLWSDEHSAVLSAQNLTEGRQLRCNRDGRSGNSPGRYGTSDIQDPVAVKGGEVDRLAELPGELVRSRDDRSAVPVRLQHRASQPSQPPAEPVSPARHALHQASTCQLPEQRIRARLRDADLGSHLGRAPMGPLDREKIKNLGGTANATHSPILISPVTSRLRVSTVTAAAAVLTHQRLPVETGATRSAYLAPFGCTERFLAEGAAITHHRVTDPHSGRKPVGKRPST
jgi:hypothetical protein